MRMKKTAAVLFAAILIVSLVVSCSDEEGFDGKYVAKNDSDVAIEFKGSKYIKYDYGEVEETGTYRIGGKGIDGEGYKMYFQPEGDEEEDEYYYIFVRKGRTLYFDGDMYTKR